MIDWAGGIPLLRRAATERRRSLVILAVAFVANGLVYALVVYPLSQRVANVEERDRGAEQALSLAQAEHARASGTLTGKARAAAELATFYGKILPPDLVGARRLTYLRLARLARESSLEYERGSFEPTVETGSALTRLKIQMVLSGTYADIRDFMYRLEASPEFVVIDNVQLVEGSDETRALVVTLDLSTYFRDGPQ